MLQSEPHIGSATDVYGCVGHMLNAAQCTALFEACYAQAPSKRHSTEREPAAKRPRRAGAKSSGALEHLGWMREFKSHAERFDSPYVHTVEPVNARLVLEQRPFCPEGFASTVWDSAIVLSKAAEHWGVSGRRCLEVGAGCGLPGLTLCALGARVTMTDLPCNLPLLRANAAANEAVLPAAPAVAALSWGEPLVTPLAGVAWDVLVATDVLYTRETAGMLVSTLGSLAQPSTECWLAAGRNRAGEDAFFAAAAREWSVRRVPAAMLHPYYQAPDVAVWRLRRRRGASGARP